MADGRPAKLRIQEVLYEAGVHRRTGTDLRKIQEVFAYVGDEDLTVTAILMTPRPEWLWLKIGNDLMVPSPEKVKA